MCRYDACFIGETYICIFNEAGFTAKGTQQYEHSMQILTGYQPYLLNLWSSHRYCGPILQASYALWSLGAGIGPFVVDLFLVESAELTSSTTFVATKAGTIIK